MSRCGWLSDGDQCEFPGTRADSISGDCRWFCAYHYRAKEPGISSQIVESSKRWAGMPDRAEAWLDRRRREVYANEPPYVTELRKALKPRNEPRFTGLDKWIPRIREPGEDDQEAA